MKVNILKKSSSGSAHYLLFSTKVTIPYTPNSQVHFGPKQEAAAECEYPLFFPHTHTNIYTHICTALKLNSSLVSFYSHMKTCVDDNIRNLDSVAIINL